MPTIELFSKNNFNLSEYDSEINRAGPANLNGAQNLSAPIDTVCINPQIPQAPEPFWVIPHFVSYTPRGYVGPALAAGCAGTKGDSDTGLSTLSVGDCSGSGYTEIQDAIEAASDGDTIEVCDGTYPGFKVYGKSLTIKAKDGHSPIIDGSIDSDETAGEAIVVQLYGSAVLTLDGFEVVGSRDGHDGIYVSIEGSGNTVNLLNLDVQGSDATGVSVTFYDSDDSVANLSNVDVSDSVESGIGILLHDKGEVEISDVNVEGSGEVGVYVVAWAPSDVKLSNVNSSGNSDDGLHITTHDEADGSHFSVEGGELSDNESHGLSTTLAATDLELSDIEIYDNSNSGISFSDWTDTSKYEEGTVTGRDLNIHDNGSRSTDEGGGIDIIWAQNVSIESSQITDNTADEGGGIYLVQASLTLINTTFDGNTSLATDSGALHLGGDATVISHYTNWISNTPNDVSSEHDYQENDVYDYGSNASFECKNNEGCSDL